MATGDAGTRRGRRRRGFLQRETPGAHAAPVRRRWWPAVLVAAVATLAVLGWQDLDLFPAEPLTPVDRSDADTNTGAGTGDGDGSEPRPARDLARTVVSIDDDGTLSVVVTLELRDRVEQLDLVVPRRDRLGGDFTPSVGSFTLDGDPAVLSSQPLRPGTRAILPLPGGSYRAVLGYEAHGAVLRTDHANPERALALVTPLVLAQSRGVSAQVEVDSVKVLNVGCLRGGAALSGCGTRTPEGWVVEVAGRPDHPERVDVVAQLNLATP